MYKCYEHNHFSYKDFSVNCTPQLSRQLQDRLKDFVLTAYPLSFYQDYGNLMR